MGHGSLDYGNRRTQIVGKPWTGADRIWVRSAVRSGQVRDGFFLKATDLFWKLSVRAPTIEALTDRCDVANEE